MPTLNLGDGADGSITISANKNINSDLITGGRSYADGVYSKVNEIGASSVTLPAGLDGLAAGDEVMLINLMGRTGYIDDKMIKEEVQDYHDRVFYICGPPAMVAGLTDMLRSKLNIPEDRVKIENFTGY